ncbi:MAG TPA: O-linked N-acetylglucosamine transferase, SPINDLY family protein [Leptolyngbyaceae cyanobacterium]
MDSTNTANWQQQAYQYMLQANYTQAASLYEQAIEAEPSVKSHYWPLGLMLLLSGQEAEAQMTWLLGMEAGEPEEIVQLTQQLMEVLEVEAQRQENLGNNSVAWLIRQHMREINPTDVNNLLSLIQITIKLHNFTGEELFSLGLIEILQSETLIFLNGNLLLQVLKSVLNEAPSHPATLGFAEACISYLDDPYPFIKIIFDFSIEIAYSAHKYFLALSFMELALRLAPKDPEILLFMSFLYQDAGEHSKGIEIAKLFSSIVEDWPSKLYATHLIIRGLLNAGAFWSEANLLLQDYKLMLQSLIEDEQSVNYTTAVRLYASSYYLPYFQDSLPNNREIHNQVARFCQVSIEKYERERIEKYLNKRKKPFSSKSHNKRLKIGYLSHCLRRHSVGWIARWLFKYHDRDRFEINGYFINAKQTNDVLHQMYVDQVSKAYKSGIEAPEVADEIDRDEVDILVDLDSLTLDTTCNILALKPAPIQATWLGWDASGIPTIDYFIADPYVLPEFAEEYYVEKIWRLPQTYVAVDGFEVGIPTLRREDLNIGNDAVIYFSSQMGFKRNPEIVKLQMKILKEVPNSYFLIKGTADRESIQNFFIEIAESEGVNSDRLRFLPDVPFEEVHRANLSIADVVLDTYPYNGATTTLETLWMGIPLVTRVGEQFASRNSYTMMVNAGITEGIAWTDDEYVEWGVRLGKDVNLRQQVVWKLRSQKQTSPLWNGRQFTREMENAYQQMWLKYLDSGEKG